MVSTSTRFPIRNALALAAATASTLGCGGPSRQPPSPASDSRAIEFVGFGDPVSHALRFRTSPRGGFPSRAAAVSALNQLTEVQDGVPGSGPPDSVELVTTATRSGAAGCGGVPESFCGDVTLRSFYSVSLPSVYVEITSMTPPTGNESYDSDGAPTGSGLSEIFGLWSYGDLTAAGTGGDNASRTWQFNAPSMINFTFSGRILDQVCTQDLSNIGTGDFRIAFTINSTQTGPVALMSQRDICNRGVFWDVRMYDGSATLELDDNVTYPDTQSLGTNAVLNDGITHTVVFARASGTVTVTVDGAPDNSLADMTNFTALPALQQGTDVCSCCDGTQDLVGTLAGICVGAP
jgi:hypothetical protein